MIFAVNATNKNEMYSFFMPITAMLWRHVIGWNSISILVGTEESWMEYPRGALVVRQARKFSRVHFLENIPGLKSTSTAQICRTYASAMPGLERDDYIVTADVDMFPLAKDWFEQRDPEKDLCVWNSQVWKTHKRMAICYLGAKVETWHEIMKIKELGMRRAIQELCKRKGNGRIDWRFDERNVTKMVTSWSGWPNRAQLITRAPRGSIYRGNGPFNKTTIGDAVDSHVWRPGFHPHNWKSIENLLRAICDKQHVQWAINYKKQFVALPARSCEQPDYRLRRKDTG